MRFFEFTLNESYQDDFVTILRNYRGRAASKKIPAKYNWATIEKITKGRIDYETFKNLYDANPDLQAIVKDFNERGLELNVPGVPEKGPTTSGTATPQTSQSAVDQAAASAAPGQLAQAQTTPQIS
jgi:hypothetical protein